VVRVRAGASGAAEATTVRKIDHDEFGNRTVTFDTGAFPERALPIGFAGGLYDQDTGLVHFGARDYDPVVGRWVSKDPILFDGGQAICTSMSTMLPSTSLTQKESLRGF